jgi:hypothetical protein
MNDLKSMMQFDEIEVYNLQFTKNEITALIKVLEFANSAATIVAMQESQKGTPAGASKMNGLAADSKEIKSIVLQSIYIGEPETDEIH